MADEPVSDVQLLRSQKAKLIQILSADADFVLQHADSLCLLSRHGYQQVKACRNPSEKVTELLDHVIQRGPESARGLIRLLKGEALQEAFPLLHFLKDLRVNAAPSDDQSKTSKKTQADPGSQESVSNKKICTGVHHLVKEKQLMAVARAIGKPWREIGRLALDVPSVKLEQFEEDHSLHVERVFAMLRYWRTSQREKATAAHLHSLLCQGDWALAPENIDFLLESD